MEILQGRHSSGGEKAKIGGDPGRVLFDAPREASVAERESGVGSGGGRKQAEQAWRNANEGSMRRKSNVCV